MKGAFFSVLLFIYSSLVFGQDLIVSSKQDSINCKISKVEEGRIWFYNRVGGSQNLQLDNVLYYKFGFFKENPHNENQNDLEEFSGKRLSFSTGLFLRTGRLNPDLTDDERNLYQDLKSGLNLDISYLYFIQSKHGIGVRYNGSFEKAAVTSPRGVLGPNLQDKITINNYGLSYAPRSVLGKSILLNQFTIGYVTYSESFEGAYSFEIKGSTIGLGYGLGLDVPITKELALGFGVDFFIATLNEFEQNGVKVKLEEENESLNRVTLTFGVRFM